MTARTTFLLTTIVAVSFLTIAAIPSAVPAQLDIVAACAPDMAAQCAGSKGEVRIACIKRRFKDFSLRCQLALVRTDAVSRACKADVKKSCADVRRGGGRIETCLKDHFEDRSVGCKETILQAAGV